MKIFPRRFRRDIIAIDFDEMDQVDWSKVRKGCIYLDIWGRIHFELHHGGYLPAPYNINPYHLFFRQDQVYQSFPKKIIATSRLKPAPDLLGARQFIYFHLSKMLVPSGVGLLSWDTLQKRGDEARSPVVGEVRKQAFDLLFMSLDEVAERLGAKSAFFPSQPIPPEKMAKHDCLLVEHPPWILRLFKWMIAFPLRNQKIYIKTYNQ